MKYVLLLFSFSISGLLTAQGNWSGQIVDSKGSAIPQASLALLEISDSTVAYFALSDNAGNVQFKNCTQKVYILNISAFGYITRYLNVDLSVKNELQLIVLKEEGTTLNAIDVVGERSPIAFKKDTIEYNAASFKTKPDAVVEDLLKKLPGLEVDAQGNIKAQGNKVEKIKIDGKEFFSNDPTLVSKNVPADAIKKVQVVDDKTDEERFSGVDDGNKNTSINLVLKDDKKNIWFGSLSGGIGGGQNPKFDANARLFQFKPTRQMAFLGMSNNINKFGFSFQDYIEFNGGLQRFMDEAGRIEFDGNSFPIDFGQPIFGMYTTGVGALNISFNPQKGINHLITGLGASKTQLLNQNKRTALFQSSGDLLQDEAKDAKNNQVNNALNYSYKNQRDSSALITLQAGIRFSKQRDQTTTDRLDALIEQPINRFMAKNDFSSQQQGANLALNYQYKFKNSFIQLLRFRAATDYIPENSNGTFLTTIQHYLSQDQVEQNMQLNTTGNQLKSNFTFAGVHALNDQTLIDLGINASDIRNENTNHQAVWIGKYFPVDSLSGTARSSYSTIQPNMSLRKQTKKWNGSIRFMVEIGNLSAQGNGVTTKKEIIALTPELNFNYDFSKTNRIQFTANRDIVVPTIDQFNPIQQSTNSLFSSRGNLYLIPEKQHKTRLNWNLYDNFSFMSIFAGIDFTYTKDKIALSRTIVDGAKQLITYANVPEDYNFRGSIDWSSPIRKLGITLHLGLTETFTKGYSFINSSLQRTTGVDHTYEARIENRKKTTFDASLGSRITLNSTRVMATTNYNTNYQKLVYFGSFDYTLKDNWNVGIELSSNQYTGTTLRETISVPLLQIEASRYLGKTKRHLISLSIFDVLNKNQGIQQNAQLNFSSTTLSNVLQQYALLKYTYRINKASTEAKGVSIQTKVR